MELLKKVTLEINKEINRKIKAKQNDTARYLLFTIVDNGVPFSLQGKEVKVFAVKPDGKLVFNACQITNPTNGEVKLNLTSQMLVVPGTLKAEIVINEGNEILSTIPFEIEVIKSLRDDSAIESTNEFSILLSKINEGQTLEESISELITEGRPLYNKLNPVVEAGKELNTSLPPKTSEADRILKQLLQVIQNGDLNRYQPKEATMFINNGGYIGVRTEGRKENQYYEFWDSVAGWAAAKFKEVYAGNGQYKVYHPNNKPAPADIGAAESNHNHDIRYPALSDFISIVGDMELFFQIPTNNGIIKIETGRFSIANGEGTTITPKHLTRVHTCFATPHTGEPISFGVVNNRNDVLIKHSASNSRNFMVMFIGK
ncbi:BppU family phage baseplate upper protein [Clostridium baratii]